MSTRCITPFLHTDKKTGEVMHLPCGRCLPCTKRRVSGWSFRLMQHYKAQDLALFVTLTFDTKHVPISKKGYMTLDKPVLQKFFKRLRKHENATRFIKSSPLNKPVSYYACGEYGGITCRPHYHIILFNAHEESVLKAWCIDENPIGQVHMSRDVNEASVGYCLKYINKPSKIPLHKNDDRLKEFALMSKGIGITYVNEQTVKWHMSDLENHYYAPLLGGKKAALPRYLKQKIYTPKIYIDDENKIEDEKQVITNIQTQFKIKMHFKHINEQADQLSAIEWINRVQANETKLKKIHELRNDKF